MCPLLTFCVVKDDVATSYLATTIAPVDVVYNVHCTQHNRINRLLFDGVDGRDD